jgi:hypothetical protein
MGACNCSCTSIELIKKEYDDSFVEEIFDIISLKDFTLDKIISELQKSKEKTYHDDLSYKGNFNKIFGERKDLQLNHYNLRMRFMSEINEDSISEENFYVALFFIYPLISKKKGSELNENFNILKKIFMNKYYDYNKLYHLFRKLFEFYSYRMNRFICIEFNEKWDIEIREDLEDFCKNVFTYENLNKRTKELLEFFEDGKEINENKLWFFIEKHNLSYPKNIRNYIIYGKKVFSHK